MGVGLFYVLLERKKERRTEKEKRERKRKKEREKDLIQQGHGESSVSYQN